MSCKPDQQVVAGAAAGVLGGLFGAGAPPALVLFAFLSTRSHLGLRPDILRASGQANYFANVFMRGILLSAQGVLFLDRWWRYYLICIVAGGLGVLAGSRFYALHKPDPVKYQKMMLVLLVVCGLFFILTPR